MEQQIARIALSGVPYSADKLYSYLVPPELADACRAGVRVSVPFGRGNRRTEGFVLETLCEAADKPLKPVFTVLDEQPLLDTSLLRLAKWMKARYFCTVYDALKTILPAGIWFRYRETYRLADGVQESDLSALAAANRTDKLLLEAVTARGELERSELEELGVSASPEKVREVVEDRLRDEIRRGVQTIQYQVVTLMTTNGQAPFVTVFMYLNEARTPQEKHDLAMIVEETLRQRYEGVKNEAGVWITPAFPKLIYVLEDDNVHEDSPYFYLTQLAAKCTAKRMVPDYISEKKMRELKLSKGETAGNGDCYTCMGCRSFLTPDRSGNGFNNVANALNYDPNKPKYYGRFNQGVVTINLPDVALSSHQDMDKFWKIFDERLELCHRALLCLSLIHI